MPRFALVSDPLENEFRCSPDLETEEGIDSPGQPLEEAPDEPCWTSEDKFHIAGLIAAAWWL